MTAQNCFLTNEKFLQLKDKIVNWVQEGKCSIEHLFVWLKDQDFLSERYNEEPYLWIVKILETDKNTFYIAKWLAEQLAVFYKSKPDLNNLSEYRRRVLFNALMLSSKLPQNYDSVNDVYSLKKHLAAPLYEMFQRRQLSGEWKGIKLRKALLSALIFNQIDNRLEQDWLRLIEEKKHDFLQGNEYDGFEGIIRTSNKSGEPPVTRIGYALARMQQHLESKNDSHYEFRRLLREVKNEYPTYADWDVQLIRQAVEHKWSSEAIICLDKLVIPLDAENYKKDTPTKWLIWKLYLPFLQSLENVSVEVIPDVKIKDVIASVKLDTEAARCLSAISPRVEKIRVNCPYDEYKNVFFSCNEVFRQMEEEFREEMSMPEITITALRKGRIYNIASNFSSKNQQKAIKALTAIAGTNKLG